MKKLIAIIILIITTLITSAAVFADNIGLNKIGSDIVNVMENMVINEPVTGNVVLFKGDLKINSPVMGQVVVIMGNVEINSIVTGQVTTILGKTKLNKNANVIGQVFTLGKMEMEAGAKVIGQNDVVRLDFLPFSFIGTILISSSIGWAFFVLLTGLIGVFAFKDKFANISAGISYKAGRKFWIGFLIYILSVILLPLVSFTVLGSIGIFIFMFFAEAIFCSWLGGLIIKNINSFGPYYGFSQFITGFTVLQCIKILPLLATQNNPILCLSVYALTALILGTVVISMGMGSIFDTKFGQKNFKGEF